MEWVTISYSRGILPHPGIEFQSLASLALGGGFFFFFFFTAAPPRKPLGTWRMCKRDATLNCNKDH